MDEPAPRRREWGIYFALGQVGMEMVIPIGLGVLVDQWLKSFPGFTAAGVVLGFVVGLVHLIYLLKRLDQTGPREPQDNK